MTYAAATALCFAVFILSVSPGPGVTAVVARALSGGLKPALRLVLGITLGDLTLLALACLGMAALAQTMGNLFLVVKLAGAAYLVYLGVQALRAQESNLPDPGTGLAAEPDRKDLLMGYLMTLGNPKAIVFYAAFLPSFLDLSQLTPVPFVVAAGIVATVVFGVLSGYAFLAARAGKLFRSRKAVQSAHRVSGAVLIGVGVAVATR